MITIRAAQDRGAANLDWLQSKHTFSFSQYYDPKQMGFGTLRVINEDHIAPGYGFPTHGHQNMEIVTYVLQGALEHKDSLGNGSVILPGDVQRMSAGHGIQHSEFNASSTDSVHLLQIWLLPEENDLKPSYEQKNFDVDTKLGALKLICSQDGHDGSVTIHQDVNIYAVVLPPENMVSHSLEPERVAWLQVAKGMVKLNDIELHAGDGAAIEQESVITLTGLVQDTEVLLFDMAT